MARQRYPLALFAAAVVLAAPAAAQEVKTEAVVVSVKGDHIQARSRTGPVTIVVSALTKIHETSGIASKKERAPQNLIPGLIITVKGEMHGGTLTASEIRFKERDWRAAIATKAGTTEQFTELRSAIIGGQEYVIRDEVTVYFATGSAAVGPSDQQHLRTLAGKAKSFGNYRISVLGFADPRGNAAANERLSQKRAAAVSNFLRQTGLIEPGRVLSPSAMGEGTVAPQETAPTSHEQARRVVVRVITPKVQLTQ